MNTKMGSQNLMQHILVKQKQATNTPSATDLAVQVSANVYGCKYLSEMN